MKRKILDFFGVTILKTETCSDSLLEEFSRFAQHATEDEAKRWLIRNMDRFTEDEQKEILYTFYEEHKRPASEKADDLSYDEMRNMLDSIAQKKN